MVRRFESEPFDVRGDGRVVLYKRGGLKKPKYQARIRVPGSSDYKRISTRTGDLLEAERFALNLYDELALHVKAGGVLNTKTFSQVFDEWEKTQHTIRPTKQGGNWNATVERVRSYALKYFGSMKIDKISSKEFSEYWLWRKTNYNRKPPSDGTLKREKTCLVPLFKFAKSRGYISDLPNFSTPAVKPERRPTFTPKEWKRIARMAREWIMDLSRFDAAPLIAFTATKETDYGTETDGRIPPGCGAYRTDKRANAQASGW